MISKISEFEVGILMIFMLIETFLMLFASKTTYQIFKKFKKFTN